MFKTRLIYFPFTRGMETKRTLNELFCMTQSTSSYSAPAAPEGPPNTRAAWPNQILNFLNIDCNNRVCSRIYC